MPRQSRLEIPGGLYHLIARGNERRTIFIDRVDYQEFLNRLNHVIEKSTAHCLAWCLMPNHFHLLILSGKEGIAFLMRRLMTGYVGAFNRRYNRVGHLFQNRYKSILCQKDSYLLQLVRYIHLNPLRAGLVDSMEKLGNYPWGGHSAMMGRFKRPFQSTEEVLHLFSRDKAIAREKYESFIGEGIREGKRRDLTGGGLLRSLGRCPGDWNGFSRNESQAWDGRVLGGGEFVEGVLKAVDDKHEVNAKPHITLEDLIKRVSEKTGVEKGLLTSECRRRNVVRAKAIYIYGATKYFCETITKMAGITKISVQAAAKARERGQEIWEGDGFNKLIS